MALRSSMYGTRRYYCGLWFDERKDPSYKPLVLDGNSSALAHGQSSKSARNTMDSHMEIPETLPMIELPNTPHFKLPNTLHPPHAEDPSLVQRIPLPESEAPESSGPV
ncbi:hypothetical protein V8E54_005042 [Elaphomyces granulatus]